MKNWILVRKSADYEYLSKELNIDPVAVRIMVNRGITELEDMKRFLDTDISDCFSYEGLPNIKEAVLKIKEAADKKLKCRIVGDYDADGVCSVTILYKGLSLYGLDCDFVIPNRLLDGYGINENIVRKAKDDGIGFIITCDNGISARDAIDLADELGIVTVVTDHHTITESEVPTKVKELVNPKMSINEYPFSDICGAQVALKVLSALFKERHEFDNIKYELLEFAAIACVTDVMPLCGENRNLVKWVLKRLNNAANPGLNKLCEKCEIANKSYAINVSDIGFRIGPCINAAGRIEVADDCVKLFLSESDEERCGLCDKLISQNNERKDLTEKCVREGIDHIEKNYPDGKLPDVLVLYLPNCHVAICGLVAGRIREKYYHPTLVFTDSNSEVTGSGRSIEEYNMIENIQKCSDLMSKFGGHKAACGLSLKKDNLKELSDRLNAMSELTEDDLTEKLYIDADMPFGYVSFRVIEDLEKLEPFGVKNQTPVFAVKNLLLVKAKRVGENHLFLSVKDAGGRIRDLKLWRRADEFEEFISERLGTDSNRILYDESLLTSKNILLTVSYYPSVNTFRNNTSIDFTVRDFKFS